MRLRTAAAAATLLLLTTAACGTPGTPLAAGSSAGGSTEVTSQAPSSESNPTSEPPVQSATDAIDTTVATPTTSTEPTQDPPAGATSTFVYYVIDARGGLRLARESRDVQPGADAPAAAIAAMISGAQDPDYTSTWNPATKVLGIDITPKLITVDLSVEARTANVGSPGAAMMIQQLIWTVTEAAGQPDTPVQLAIVGKPAGELWGAVTWGAPMAREEATAIRSLVQIDSPRDGAETASPVRISGEAAAFEANVPWRILDSSGTVVASGHATTTEGMTFAPYSFDADLAPGSYTVEVSEDDPSDGAAGPPTTDTRRFTVSG